MQEQLALVPAAAARHRWSEGTVAGGAVTVKVNGCRRAHTASTSKPGGFDTAPARTNLSDLSDMIVAAYQRREGQGRQHGDRVQLGPLAGGMGGLGGPAAHDRANSGSRW